MNNLVTRNENDKGPQAYFNLNTDITFNSTENEPVLVFKQNGDLFWKGREIKSDEELREAVIGLHTYFCNRRF